MRFSKRALASIAGLLLIAPILLASCRGSGDEQSSLTDQRETPDPTAATAQTGTNPTPTAAIPVPTAEQPTSTAAGPIATPLLSPESTPAATPIASLGLFLKVIGTDSESIVQGNTVIIEGVTNPDAILSINGIIASIDEDGDFEMTVSLDPGTNLIEVIASDFEGNQETAILAIVSLSQA